MADRLLTTKEAATRLGISYQYMRKLVTTSDPSKLPPFIMVGNCRRFPESRLDSWIQNNAGSA